MSFASRGRQFATVFAVAGGLVCLYAMRQADPDLWGYLTYGKLFAGSGGLTSHDPFAYTSTGFQWTTFEYGAQLLLWWAYHFAGPIGLIALKCVVGGAALWCLFIAVRDATDEPFIWVPIFLLCIAICRFFVFALNSSRLRSSLSLSWCCSSFSCASGSAIWALPIVMLAWANLHGEFSRVLGRWGWSSSCGRQGTPRSAGSRAALQEARSGYG